MSCGFDGVARASSRCRLLSVLDSASLCHCLCLCGSPEREGEGRVCLLRGGRSELGAGLLEFIATPRPRSIHSLSWLQTGGLSQQGDDLRLNASHHAWNRSKSPPSLSPVPSHREPEEMILESAIPRPRSPSPCDDSGGYLKYFHPGRRNARISSSAASATPRGTGCSGFLRGDPRPHRRPSAILGIRIEIAA